jgi:hypothetical protein
VLGGGVIRETTPVERDRTAAEALPVAALETTA